jgi:hypothetical protein
VCKQVRNKRKAIACSIDDEQGNRYHETHSQLQQFLIKLTTSSVVGIIREVEAIASNFVIIPTSYTEFYCDGGFTRFLAVIFYIGFKVFVGVDRIILN